MYCAKAGQQLQLYIDHRLPLEHMRALEMHLAHCTACQKQLFKLEQISQTLRQMELVVEPCNLTTNIMQRVALTPQHVENPPFELLRPSLSELVAAIILATIATMGVFLGQPALRAALPIGNGHDVLSLAFLNAMHMLASMNSETLMISLWVIGTILGVWITMLLAGNEMRRTEWFKSVIDRLPVR